MKKVNDQLQSSWHIQMKEIEMCLLAEFVLNIFNFFFKIQQFVFYSFMLRPSIIFVAAFVMQY